MIRLETALAVTGVIALTALIGFFGIKSEQKQRLISAPVIVEAAEPTAKPCNQPAEIYLQEAQNILNNSASRSFRPGTDAISVATAASAWMQMYQICTARQNYEGLHTK